ncbi:hypothetical protein WA158_000012 [Blastocystis sp. Blastoise]
MNSNNQNSEKPYTIALAGPKGAGKTALLLQLVEKNFIEETTPTKFSFSVPYVFDIGGKSIYTIIQDIEGCPVPNKEFFGMVSDANVVCIVFNMSTFIDTKSFEQWKEELSTLRVNNKSSLLFFVGTHCDLIDDNRRKEIAQTLQSLNISLFICSATNYLSVFQVFQNICENMLIQFPRLSPVEASASSASKEESIPLPRASSPLPGKSTTKEKVDAISLGNSKKSIRTKRSRGLFACCMPSRKS